jgi:hypothetical protein
MPPFQNQYMRGGYQPNIHALINRAQHDIGNERPTQRPGVASLAYNHPGFLGYAIRSQDEYNDAVRHDKLVKRLREIREQFPEQYKNTVAYMGQDGTPVRYEDVPIDQDTTPSPYRFRGYNAPGQPWREGSDWIRAVFSIPQNMARVIGHSGPPTPEQADADRDYISGLDVALLGIPSMVSGGETNPTWKNDVEKPFNSMSRFMEQHPGNKPNAVWGLLEQKPTIQRDGITSFSQVAREFGAPDSMATDIIGGLGDAVTDPFPFGVAGVRNLMAKQYVPAVKNFGKELLPYVAMNAMFSSPKNPPPPAPKIMRGE